MSLRLGGGPRKRSRLVAMVRRLSFSQVGGYGPDLRVRVVVRATPLACATTPGPDADPDRAGELWEGHPPSSHPEAGGTEGRTADRPSVIRADGMT
jgi:hypothetical protein